MKCLERMSLQGQEVTVCWASRGKGGKGLTMDLGFLFFFLLFCKNENFLNLMAAQLEKKSF